MNLQGSYQPDTQFSLFPPAIKHLLIINGLIFLAYNTPIFRDLFYQYLALWHPVTGNFWPWQLVSYMFMHGSFMHIFFNLFVLWMFGQQIERLWGTKRFVTYYFLTGIGAAGIHMLIAPGGIPMVGASGAVYGILLAFAMMFPNREIFFLLIPFPIKAKYFVFLIGGAELLFGITGAQTGIAHFAHLGGLLVGFILIKVWGIRGGYY